MNRSEKQLEPLRKMMKAWIQPAGDP